MKPFDFLKRNGHPPGTHAGFESTQPNLPPASNAQTPIDDSPIIIETDIAFDPSDGNDRRFHLDAAMYKDPFWRLGWTDGRVGQPLEETAGIVAYQAEIDCDNRIARARQQVAEAQAKIQELTVIVEGSEASLNELRTHHTSILAERLTNSAESSWPLGMIYSIVALILFIADLPLSLKLVAVAFNIPTKKDGVSVDDLMWHPINVMFTDWEAMFLAMGIAFSGVFVKFYLDEVLLWSQPQERKLTQAQKSEGEERDNAQEKSSQLSKKIRLIMFWIAILYVGTTVMLGAFRAYQVKPSSTSSESATTAGSPIVSSVGKTAADSQPKSDPIGYTLEFFAFILLTLMFPILGGVCFSAGWRKLAKAQQLRRVARELITLEQTSRPNFEQWRQAKSDLMKGEVALELAQDTAKREPLINFRLNLYRHGYFRGSAVPETLHVDDGLYPQAKRIVDKFLAQRLRTKLWEGTSRGGGLNTADSRPTERRR